MSGAEVVVEFEIDLLSGLVLADAPQVVGAVQAANPAAARGVQTVADVIVVHGGHVLEQNILHETGRIKSSPVRIPGIALDDRIRTVGPCRGVQQGTEYTGVAQNSIVRSTVRIRGRRLRIARPVDDADGRCGAAGVCRREGIAVGPIVVVAENALLHTRRQHLSHHRAA